MLHFLTQSPWIERTGWVLIHSLWQFAILALVAIVLQWALRRRAAATRYVALLAIMSMVVALPAVTWFAIGPMEKPVRAGVPASAGPSGNSRLKAELQRADFPPQLSVDSPQFGALPAEYAKPQAAAIPSEAEPRVQVAWWSNAKSRLEPWLPAVVLVWFAGVALFALRPLASWYTVRRLRTRGVSPVAGSIRDVLTRTAKRLRLTRAVTILQSTLVKTPVVIGYFCPLILLPVCIATGLPESQLELILAHELAHIRRHDYLVNLLQTLIETLFFYHPAVWWLSRQIRHERENCCDDIALSLSANRADYGRALLAIEELRAAAPALSVAAGGGSLLTRIRRIVNMAEPKAPVTRSSSLLVLAGILTLAMVAGRYALLGHAKDVKSDKSPSDAAAKIDDTPGDVLEGIVVDEQGKPVAGAIVRAGEYTEEDSTTTSGADGKFRLAVRAPFVVKGAITASDAREKQRGVVTSRFPNNAIRIVLKPSRSVDMTVVDARGQPVAGADVAALLWNGQIAAGKTDIHGKARVEIPVEASDVTILAYKSGVGMDYSSPDAANLVLDGTATVEVKTVDSAGKLVTGLGIRVEDLTKRGKGRLLAWNAKLSAKSDGKGRAVYDYLPARVESVEFAVDAPMGTGDYVAANAAFDIREGGDPRHITARVVRAATLRGRVTLPDGKPAAGILVQAEGRPGNANPMSYDREWTRTARDGTYEVKVAPDQDYIIAVCDDNLAAPSHLGVIVKEGEKREGLDFRLARGTLIRGRITVGPARRPGNDANLTYPIIDLVQKGPPMPESWRWPDRRQRGIDQYRTSLARWADLDADGYYATRIAAGDYNLDLPSGVRRIVVADQKEMVIDDYLPDVVPKSVQGKVVDRAGKPVAGAIVAFSNNQHLITDKDGRFDAPGVMGPPRIFARSAESNLAGSQAVAKEDTRVTIELSSAATASGRVLDASGRPAAGVHIRYDFFQHPPKEHCYFPVETETDKDGKFMMSGLPIGFEGDETYLTWYNPAKNIFEVFDGPKFTVRAGENRLPDAVLSPATKKKSDKDSGKTSAVKPASDDKAIEEQAINTKSASWGYRHRRTFLADGGQFNLVGLLVTNGYWRKSLPLAPAQATAITKLDDLIQQAFDNVALAAADYMDTNPPDYHEYNARFTKRLNKAISRAERMVALGLLTEPQAAFVMQRHLTNGSTGSRLYPLRDENVQELLGLTASQLSDLDKVGAEANRREAPLNLWSTDPKEQQSVKRSMEANAKWLDEAAMNVLTPAQRATWSRLAAERHLPATPPDLPAPSVAEAARIKVDEVSPVFRALAEKPDEFRLSSKQKKLLAGLKDITREGLFWIGRSNSKNAGEFVKQAEQVALLGILTEQQAALVGQLAPAGAKASDQGSKTYDEPTNNEAATESKPAKAREVKTGTGSSDWVVSGTVVDEHDRPIEGAEVRSYQRLVPRSQRLVQTARTDAQGKFRLSWSLDTNYRHPITFSKTGFASRILFANALKSPPPQDFGRLALSKPQSIRGRVTGPEGRPIAGADVWTPAFDGPIPGIQSTKSDANGYFEISDVEAWKDDGVRPWTKYMPNQPLRPGTAKRCLRVRHADYGTKLGYYSQVPVTVNVAFDKPAVITGRIIDPATSMPLAGIWVDLETIINPNDVYGHDLVVTDRQGGFRLMIQGGGPCNLRFVRMREDASGRQASVAPKRKLDAVLATQKDIGTIQVEFVDHGAPGNLATPKADDPSGKTSAAESANGAATFRNKLKKEWADAGLGVPSDFIPLPAYRNLEMPDVRKHLGITAEQEKKLWEIAADYHAVTKKLYAAHDDWLRLPPPQRKTTKEEGYAKLDQARHAFDKPVADVLTAEQRAAYQHDVRGDNAFNVIIPDDPQYLQRIFGFELSEQQRQQLTRLREEVEENWKKTRTSMEAQTLAVLTPQQREKLLARFSDAEPFRPSALVPGSIQQKPPREKKPSLDFRFASGSNATIIVSPELTDADVRKVLALTAEQEAKLLALDAKSQAAAIKLFERYELKASADESPEARNARHADYRRKKDDYQRTLKQFAQEVIGQIVAVLQARQIAALKAMAQKDKAIGALEGLNRAALDDIHAAAEQRAKLRQIWEEYEAREYPVPNMPLPSAAGEKAWDILTPDQQKKVDEVIQRWGW